MFNTLKYAKILEEVGFSREQAETSIKILVEIMEDKMATKQDLKELKSDLTIRLGSMIAGAIVIMTTVQTWLMHH